MVLTVCDSSESNDERYGSLKGVERKQMKALAHKTVYGYKQVYRGKVKKLLGRTRTGLENCVREKRGKLEAFAKASLCG